MAGVYVLTPAPAVQQGQLDYVAITARRAEEGLWADVQVVNGKPKWGDAVLLSSDAARRVGAVAIARAAGCSEDAAAGALLELHGLVEVAIRHAAVVPEWQPPAPFVSVDMPAFPMGALPGPLRRFVAEVSGAFQTPHDYAGMAVLSAIGTAVGNRRRVHIVGSIYAGACLWVVLIGKPGSGKSDPLEMALAPFRAIQDAYVEEYQRAREKYEDDLADFESQKPADRGEKPKAPDLARILVADATLESLALELQANPLGMVLYRDELATWLAGFDKYRAQGGGSDRANYLEMWSGKTIDVSRKTGIRVIYVPRPFLSVIGTIQPERIQDILGNVDDGFFDRLLCVMPPTGVSPLPSAGVDPAAYGGYAAIVRRIMGQFPQEDGRAEVVELSPRALVRFKERAAALDDLMRDDTLPPTLLGAYAKLRIYASRLTLVCQQASWACGEAEAEYADMAHVDAAWDLVEYLRQHARRVHAARMADPHRQLAQDMLALIARKRWAQFSRRDVYRWMPSRLENPEAAEEPLALLIDLGYLREHPMPEQKGPGRKRSQVYDVNPLWDSQNSHNSQNRGNPAPPEPSDDPGPVDTWQEYGDEGGF